jgi:hypothetical protein
MRSTLMLHTLFMLTFSKTEINGCRYQLRWPRDILYQQKLALISPAWGLKATEFVFYWSSSFYIANINKILQSYIQCSTRSCDRSCHRISSHPWNKYSNTNMQILMSCVFTLCSDALCDEPTEECGKPRFQLHTKRKPHQYKWKSNVSKNV